MAKKQGISYSADAGLIRGEGAMRQAGGFVDIAGSMNKGIDRQMKVLQQAAEQREARSRARNAEVKNYLQTFNSNVDVSALSPQNQKEINNFLMGVKDRYAAAASAIVNFTPGTPEYMEQLDIMNNEKNAIATAKAEIDGFKDSKVNYSESVKDQSEGNSEYESSMAGLVFTGRAPLSLKENGQLVFQDKEGKGIDYKDIKMPFKQAYQQAIEYNDLFTPIYSSGSYDATKQKMFEDRIKAFALNNPEAMKSIVADKLSSFGNFETLIPLLDDPNLSQELVNGFVKISSEAARGAAANGKQAKISNQKESRRTQEYIGFADTIRQGKTIKGGIPVRRKTNQFLVVNKDGLYEVRNDDGVRLDVTDPMTKEEALIFSGYSTY
jgi:hypothetical protein